MHIPTAYFSSCHCHCSEDDVFESHPNAIFHFHVRSFSELNFWDVKKDVCKNLFEIEIKNWSVRCALFCHLFPTAVGLCELWWPDYSVYSLFLHCHTVRGVSWAFCQTFSVYQAAGKDLTFLFPFPFLRFPVGWKGLSFPFFTAVPCRGVSVERGSFSNGDCNYVTQPLIK